jgi:CubicO group peptidase (beta-lactamase class C family)
MEQAAGRGWTELVDLEVFTPLAMSSSTCNPHSVPRDRVPLAYYDDPSTTESLDDPDLYGACAIPGGPVFTTSDDLSRLLIALLNEGVVDGRTVLPAEAVTTSLESYTPLGEGVPSTTAFGTVLGYGIGWSHLLYEGETLLMTRMPSATMLLIPSRGVGVAMLSAARQLGSLMNDPSMILKMFAAAYICDSALGVPGAHEKHLMALEQFSTMMDQLESTMALEMEQADDDRPERRPAPEPIALRDLVGTYENPLLGRITCEIIDEELEVSIGSLRGRARPSGYLAKMFVVPSMGHIEFALSDEGHATGLEWSRQEFWRVEE